MVQSIEKWYVQHMRFETYDDEIDMNSLAEDTSANEADPDGDGAVRAQLQKSGAYFEELDPTSEITDEEKEFLSDLRFFCSEYVKEFDDIFWKAIESHEISPGRKISGKIKDYLGDNKLDLPVFVIRNGTEAAKFLNENNLAHPMEGGHFLLEFRLPKQLGYFWWKDRRSDHKNQNIDAKRKKIEDAGIAWGDIYRSIRPIMWDKIINQYGDGKIDFERINPPRAHKATGYYYLFDVSPMSADQSAKPSQNIDIDKD